MKSVYLSVSAAALLVTGSLNVAAECDHKKAAAHVKSCHRAGAACDKNDKLLVSNLKKCGSNDLEKIYDYLKSEMEKLLAHELMEKHGQKRSDAGKQDHKSKKADTPEKTRHKKNTSKEGKEKTREDGSHTYHEEAAQQEYASHTYHHAHPQQANQQESDDDVESYPLNPGFKKAFFAGTEGHLKLFITDKSFRGYSIFAAHPDTLRGQTFDEYQPAQIKIKQPLRFLNDYPLIIAVAPLS